ncbi:hypothetical protein EV561_13048 [Rhizobium sp. BK376]|nr:hypothetical protein EV561_13048 [Rhizobium sp. BK376]
MAAADKPPRAGAQQKPRHKFNPKRDAKPQVLAEANRTVFRIASAVIVAFLVIVAVQVFW